MVRECPVSRILRRRALRVFMQIMMELTFKKQRETIEQERAGMQEDVDMLSRCESFVCIQP